MTKDEILAATIIRPCRKMLFEPVFPPQERQSNTFFGGLPRLPENLSWPSPEIFVEHDESGGRVRKEVASTFLAQIDLSELPVKLSSLPEIGTLYFFLESATPHFDFERKPGTGGQVLFSPGASSTLPERCQPASLAPCYGNDWPYHFSWLKQLSGQDRAPRSFPRCPMRAVSLRSLHFAMPPFDWSRAPVKTAGVKDRQTWLAYQRAYTEIARHLERETRRFEMKENEGIVPARNYFVARGGGSDWRGGKGFPYAWIDVEVFCGELLDKLHRRPGQGHQADPNTDRVNAAARDWIERVGVAGRYAAVGESDRQSFDAWYDAMLEVFRDNRAMLSRCMEQAYRVGPRLSLLHSPAAARNVPQSWLNDQRWQFAIRFRDGEDIATVQHELLPRPSVGPSWDADIRDGDEVISYIPLMTFASQEGLSWMWGDVGTLEFQIPKQDVPCLRFDRVRVLVHSG